MHLADVSGRVSKRRTRSILLQACDESGTHKSTKTREGFSLFVVIIAGKRSRVTVLKTLIKSKEKCSDRTFWQGFLYQKTKCHAITIWRHIAVLLALSSELPIWIDANF